MDLLYLPAAQPLTIPKEERDDECVSGCVGVGVYVCICWT